MQTLEGSVKEAHKLWGDMHETIVVRGEIGHREEEEGHLEPPREPGEEVYYRGRFYAGSSPWGTVPGDDLDAGERWVVDKPAGWVVDSPEIFEPNIPLREKAKKRLQEISRDSLYFSAKYIAVTTLFNHGKQQGKIEPLLEEIEAQVRRLEGDLRTKNESAVLGLRELSEDLNSLRWEMSFSPVFNSSGGSLALDTVVGLRNRARSHLPEFKHKEELRKTYNTRGFPKKARIEAGLELGYSRAEIRSDVEPVKSFIYNHPALTGIATAASVLGGFLCHYLSR